MNTRIPSFFAHDPSGLALRIVLIVLGLLLLMGCGPDGGHASAATPDDHASHAAPAATAAGGEASAAPYAGSVYDLGSTWTDQAGAERALAELGGQVRVIAMVYASCTHTCPLIVADLKRLESALGARASEVGFTLVTLDPERDTPERLAEFARSTRLDAARWTLLTGTDDAVLDLSAALGVRYRAGQGGEIAHSNVYLVLDQAGTIVHRQAGLGGDTTPALDAITQLLD